MNPFESYDKTFSNDSNLFFSETSRSTDIVIRIEKTGSKTKTFICGWNIPKEEMKKIHLTSITKATGCGGAILVDKDTDANIIQLHGNQVAFVKDYLVNKCDILEEFITIKGV